MKMNTMIKAILSVTAVSLFGCGGGGGGGAPVTAPPPAGSLTLKGVVAKGPINGGDIRVLALKADGTPDTANPLATGKTLSDNSGGYTITIPPDRVPKDPNPTALIIEVSNGTYTDEATGSPVTMGPNTKLRAVVSTAADGDRIAVTPLTELAYKKAEGTGSGKLLAANIDDANTAIGSTFNVPNIIKNQPFDPTKTAPAGITADDKQYAGALGVFSQMVKERKDKNGSATLAVALDDELNSLGAEMNGKGAFSPATIADINTAIDDFNKSHPTLTGTATPKVVLKAGVLTVSTVSSPPLAAGTAISGIDFTVNLPAGITVKTKDAVSGEVVDSAFPLSSAAASLQNVVKAGKFDKAAKTLHIMVLNVQPGFATGEFMHVNFDVDTAGGGTFPTDPNAFTITINQVSGGSDLKNTATLTGITATNEFAGL